MEIDVEKHGLKCPACGEYVTVKIHDFGRSYFYDAACVNPKCGFEGYADGDSLERISESWNEVCENFEGRHVGWSELKRKPHEFQNELPYFVQNADKRRNQSKKYYVVGRYSYGNYQEIIFDGTTLQEAVDKWNDFVKGEILCRKLIQSDSARQK